MASFFSLLRYSFGNEDWKTEEEALDIQPNDRVLCITASGDRPLNLLSRECQKIVCVDANPVQNFLLQLKAAAMSVLEYEDYLSFLGARAGNHRKETLHSLFSSMPPKAAEFWKAHEKMVSKGIIYQGAVERLTYFTALAFKLFRGKKVDRLFSMDNIEDQRKFAQNEWDSYFWRQIFNLVLNPLFSRFLIEDPGLKNAGANIKPGTYIYERIQSTLSRQLASETPLLSLLLRGRVTEEGFSPYLTKQGIQSIKTRLSSLEIHTTNILHYLDSIREPAFDIFSLSDVASYLSYEDFIKLLQGIIRTAKPGARFCLRQFLSTYEIPLELQSYFVRDKELEKNLEQKDNCFVYRFLVGTINKESFSRISGRKEEKILVPA